MILTPASPTHVLFAASAKHAMDASINYVRLIRDYPLARDRSRYEAEVVRWRESAWRSLAEAREAKGLAEQ